MTSPIKVIIKGSGASGTDAPTVDDLLGQVRDFVDVLKGVERALETDGNQIVWRVTNVTQNSPIAIELTPYPENAAAFVGYRAERVERATSDGLLALQQGVERPPYFTDDVLPKARKLHERVTNGLSDTRIEFGALQAEAPILITKEIAREVAVATAARAVAGPVAYRELGSIEGFFAKAELDGFGRPILWFRHRLDNATLKAVATGPAIRQLEQTKLGDVWKGARIRVYGTIFYKDLGVIDHINADYLEPIEDGPLPGPDDIIDPNFTGGLSTEEFLDEVRNG